MEPFMVWGLTTLVTAFCGSFLASYLKKKGANLATHEDIDQLPGDEIKLSLFRSGIAD